MATKKENCFNCGSDRLIRGDEVFDTRFGIDCKYLINRCERCGIELTSPLPNQSQLNDLYENHYNSSVTGSLYAVIRERFISSLFYRTWVYFDGDISFNFFLGSGKLLDVGCNEGRGLEFFSKNGFYTEGLELNKKAASVARERGFVVHEKTLEDFDSDKKYDFVVLSNVIEHSLNPNEMLKKIHDITSTNGRLLISCPNSESWLRNLFRGYWINWHVPFHITHFSNKTISEILKKNNFKIETVRYETPALWVAHSFVARMFALPGKPTRQLRYPLLIGVSILIIRLFLFPILWLGNATGRGDCIVLTAVKE